MIPNLLRLFKMHEFFTFRPENRINTIISMNIFPMEEKFLKHDLKSLIKPLRLNNSFNSSSLSLYREYISDTIFLIFGVPGKSWRKLYVSTCITLGDMGRKLPPSQQSKEENLPYLLMNYSFWSDLFIGLERIGVSWLTVVYIALDWEGII